MESYSEREHAGVNVKLVWDDDPALNPYDDYDHAGKVVNWDNAIWIGMNVREPGYYGAYGSLAEHFEVELVVPLRFRDYGSSGARLDVIKDENDANCAWLFTANELAEEWNGNHAKAHEYVEASVGEIDHWLQGNVWGIVIEHDGEQVEACWGFIGEPDSDWIRDEANALAEYAAKDIAKERAEQYRWACADVVTI